MGVMGTAVGRRGGSGEGVMDGVGVCVGVGVYVGGGVGVKVGVQVGGTARVGVAGGVGDGGVDVAVRVGGMTLLVGVITTYSVGVACCDSRATLSSRTISKKANIRQSTARSAVWILGIEFTLRYVR